MFSLPKRGLLCALTSRGFPFRGAFVLLLAGGLVVGCASSRSSGNAAAARAAVIGTWKYRVSGIAPLDRGIIHITMRNGRLRGYVRDRRRGRLLAQVDVSNSRLVLTTRRLHISGNIENGRLNGFLRYQRWNASVRFHRRRTWSSAYTAPIFARRVQSGAMANVASALECRSILREANGCR